MAVAIIPEINDNHNPDNRSEQQDLSSSADTVLSPGSRRVSQDLQWVEGVYDLVNRNAHEANSLGFSSWIFTQVSLPYQDPGKHGSKAWVRRNGDITMTLTPAVSVDDNGDVSLEYPFGKYPRLILPWITTQVVRCQADIDNDGTLTLPVADSLRAFMVEIGQSWGGKSGRIVRDQTRRLLSSSISVSQRITALPGKDERVRMRQMNVADSFALWWGRDAGLEDDGSVPLWGNEVCLSAPFVQSVLSNPIPTDLRALKLLSDKGGSMAMDIYSWMSYRLYTARKPSLITWETLASQFGSRTKETWKFKQQFVAKLDVVKLVYRSARFSVQDEGLLIFPSLSPLGDASRGKIQS